MTLRWRKTSKWNPDSDSWQVCTDLQLPFRHLPPQSRKHFNVQRALQGQQGSPDKYRRAHVSPETHSLAHDLPSTEESGGQALSVPAALPPLLFKTSKGTLHCCRGKEWETGAQEQVLQEKSENIYVGKQSGIPLPDLKPSWETSILPTTRFHSGSAESL